MFTKRQERPLTISSMGAFMPLVILFLSLDTFISSVMYFVKIVSNFSVLSHHLTLLGTLENECFHPLQPP